jgi:hypothetical protein
MIPKDDKRINDNSKKCRPIKANNNYNENNYLEIKVKSFYIFIVYITTFLFLIFLAVIISFIIFCHHFHTVFCYNFPAPF